MEVVEELSPCTFQPKEDEGLMAQSSTDVDSDSKGAGCVTAVTVEGRDNNTEVVDAHRKSSCTDINMDQNSEISKTNRENTQVLEVTSCTTANNHSVEMGCEESLENYNTDQKSDDKVLFDCDKTTTIEGIQSSKQEGIDQEEIDSKAESAICNVSVGAECSAKMGDCKSETPKIDNAGDTAFCNMSDLVYVTDLVAESQTNAVKSMQEVEDKSPAANCDNLLEKASQLLGKRLVALEYDSSGTEDSSASTTELSSSSTETSSSSSSSSSSSEISDEEKLPNAKHVFNYDEGEGVHHQPPKTKDEILPQELPVEEEALWDGLPEGAKLEPVGDIQSFVELMLVIKAFKDTVALDADTIFFKKDRRPFGKVYDVFGPVQSPFYVIRFCNEKSYRNTGLNIGDTVYYAPDFLHVTKFVFVEQLKKMKGSDASWQHDQEPPPEFLDYSDDEEEAKAKSAAKKKRQSEINKIKDDSANDADGEGDGSVKGKKFRRGKKVHLKGKGHPTVKSSFEDKTSINGMNNARTSSNTTGTAPSPSQPFCHKERLSFTQPIADLSNVRFNSNFGQSLQRPFFRPNAPQNTRLRACQQSFDRNFIGNVTEPQITSMSAFTEDTSTCDQDIAPSSQQRGLQDGRVSLRGQGSSFRPGYTFPPPPPPGWSVFDPSVPPPNFPTRAPSRPPARLPPRFPTDFPPPNVRNPPMPPTNLPPPNWRPPL